MDRRQACDRPQVQEVLARNDRWPGLVKTLVDGSSGFGIGGCRLIFRTDRSGVISDSVCRKEVALLNCWLLTVGGLDMPIFEAKQFRLYNIDGPEIDMALENAIVWANGPASDTRPSSSAARGSCVDDPTGVEQCDKNLEEVVAYTFAATFASRDRLSSPLGKGIVVNLPDHTEPVVDVNVFLAATYAGRVASGHAGYRPSVPRVQQSPPIVVDAATVRPSAAKRAKSSAADWLGDEPYYDVERGVWVDGHAAITERRCAVGLGRWQGTYSVYCVGGRWSVAG